MKKRIFLVIIVLTLFPFCKKFSNKAVDYNNTIATEMKYLADIEEDMATKDGPELDVAIERFKKAVPESKAKIEQIGKFEEDDAYQKAALGICLFYEEVINGKWREKGQEAIQLKNEELNAALQKEQYDFAIKYKFEIKK